ENEKLRSTWICRKCEKETIQTLFLPCRHLVMCDTCAESSDYCLYCFEKVLGTVKTFKV
ncbi:hypothetical protein HELRODRAFT_74680, partial [Helobdella robusta]|uniref:RING-type domain-containing protein n=1 Tax=Helobdella robusta TaxID=6412 RepID=T1G1U0_HELRO